MATKLQRYEASVKLANKRVVQYHNINTGLFKFHNFISKKFGKEWVYYSIRRIETKEVLATYRNEKINEIKAIKIYLPKQANPNKTGYFVRFPFEREGFQLNRNIFFADKIILDHSNEYIVIPENIYITAIENAKIGLKEYYENKEHVVYASDFTLEEFEHELFMYKRVQEGTAPEENYP